MPRSPSTSTSMTKRLGLDLMTPGSRLSSNKNLASGLGDFSIVTKAGAVPITLGSRLARLTLLRTCFIGVTMTPFSAFDALVGAGGARFRLFDAATVACSVDEDRERKTRR